MGCQRLGPALAEFADSQGTAIKAVQFDVDTKGRHKINLGRTLRQLGVLTVPQVFVFHRGEVIAHAEGAQQSRN